MDGVCNELNAFRGHIKIPQLWSPTKKSVTSNTLKVTDLPLKLVINGN